MHYDIINLVMMMKMSAVSIGRKLLADWFFLVAFSMVHGLRFFFFFFFPHASQFFGGSYACSTAPLSQRRGSSQLLLLRRKLSFYVLNEGSKRREKGSKAIQHGTLVIYYCNLAAPLPPPRVPPAYVRSLKASKTAKNDYATTCLLLLPIEEPTKHDLMVMRSALPV